MSTDTVDVIIVSWNVREDLLGCLESIQRSSDVSLNVVVVDNASADGSADAVASAAPWVRLVRNETNMGFARAANQGIRLGNAPLVLLLNPDTLVPPTAIAVLADTLDRLPKHAAVAPRLVDDTGADQHSVYRFPSITVSLILATGAQFLLPASVRSRLLLVGSWRSNLERDVPWAIGAALLVRRTALESVGMLDERFFVYTEDLDWCYRAQRLGMPIRFIPAVELVHRGNRSGTQRYGDDHTAAKLRTATAWARSHHGWAWCFAFATINGLATVGRYGIYRLLARIVPRRRWDARLATWAPYARFYMGRAGPKVD